jgi:site-specific DNA-methyltransferase (adenine-specific)
MIKLIKGDCLEVMKSIPDGSVDAIITDPPYGTTACKWDSVIPFDLMWKELNRIVKPNGSKVIFAQQPFTSVLVVSNINQYRHKWNWVKDKSANFMVAKGQPLKYCEEIVVFNSNGYLQHHNATKKCATYNPQMREGKGATRKYTENERKGHLLEINHRDNATPVISYGNSHKQRYPKDNLEQFTTVHKNRLHPTQKPIALMEYLIKTYTNEGETVLDFTMGSGSTMVACQNTNRNGIGIEQDENYFKIATNRINQNKLLSSQRS